MKFALLNPNWDFKGSTYFGCQDPHVPLELMFAADQLLAAGQDSLLVDAQTDNLTLQEARHRVDCICAGLSGDAHGAFVSLSGDVRHRSSVCPWSGLPH